MGPELGWPREPKRRKVTYLDIPSGRESENWFSFLKDDLPFHGCILKVVLYFLRYTMKLPRNHVIDGQAFNHLPASPEMVLNLDMFHNGLNLATSIVIRLAPTSRLKHQAF